MSTERNIEDAVSETLEAAFNQAALVRIGKELEPRLELFVTQNAEQGRFLGGPKANEGYSTSPIPAWYLGSLESRGDGGWNINPQQAGRVSPSQDELIWRTQAGNNKPTAFLLGGYKKFRQLLGTIHSYVNLTLTGAMLNSVQAATRLTSNGARVTTGATGGQQDKAYYTNKQREWLGLHRQQQAIIESDVVNYIAKEIRQLDDVTINL